MLIVVPAGLHALAREGVALASPLADRVLGQDPNLLSDRIIIFVAFAMAAYAMTRDPGSVRPVTSPAFLGCWPWCSPLLC
ncbi:MAG: hypothetical protein U5R48_15640 [Gammaproteobacteria bacterium]|nr:hypothetical protein [Gammaproteobacteria bacterium]